MGRTLTIVLGGGRGTRLFPLTKLRAKPAVPLAGQFRLIDIPISNALNSGLREIFVLTQFNSHSLNSHISKTFRFDVFSKGFVEVLAAEQTEQSRDWFQGTADAVRQHLHHFKRSGVENVLILAGDHLYRMDYRHMLWRHGEMDADITVSTIAVNREQCEGFGVLAANADGSLRAFREKPGSDEDISDLAIPETLRTEWKMGEKSYLASMGVYVFKIDVLVDLLSNEDLDDFGRDILPRAIHTHNVAAYLFSGYWEDIGTIKAFYEANLLLARPDSPFDFYDRDFPIYTRPRFLPPSVVIGVDMQQAVVGHGSQVYAREVSNSVIGQRSLIGKGCTIHDSIIMGADFYERADRERKDGEVPVGVGAGTSIRRAIIDKNARIGENCVIHGDPERPDQETEAFSVRDGVVVVAKNATIPPGTVI